MKYKFFVLLLRCCDIVLRDDKITLTFLFNSVNDNIMKNAEFKFHWSFKLKIFAKDIVSFRTQG